jgi:hypothetical protein
VEYLYKELALHFTAGFPTDPSADVSNTVMWWCILLSKTCHLESFD